MNKTRISLLSFVFLVALFTPQPGFIFQNFWSRADFWEALPFTPSVGLYIFLYAVTVTGFVELFIRFVKKYA
jgi:hypothetical protein